MSVELHDASTNDAFILANSRVVLNQSLHDAAQSPIMLRSPSTMHQNVIEYTYAAIQTFQNRPNDLVER
jgi:hypothetical protein